MTKVQTKPQSGKLKTLYPRSAGIDVGATMMQVCIPKECEDRNNRDFGTTTKSLDEIVQWLLSHSISHVAMEATGIYWIPLFNKLSKAGLTAVLLNAADVKNYTARKTDVNDAEWLMTLMQYGMVKPSFQIDAESRSLRNCTRHRAVMVSLCSDTIRRMQKTLELMNLKLTEVLSDITGESGIKIIEAILSGERSPLVLASLTSKRCKKTKEEIAEALEGTWEEELVFILSQHYEVYKMYRRQTLELDAQIQKALEAINEKVLELNGGEVIEVPRSKKTAHKRNAISVDVENLSTQIWGVNLTAIDGVSNITVLSLMGELGRDFTKDFKTVSHFCSWCNLTPNDKISGGKLLSSRRSKRVNQVGLVLRNCAQTISQSKSVFGDYYRRMKAKGGGKFAVCATAHKLAAIIFVMVRDKTPFNSAKVSINDKEWIAKRIKRQEKLLEKLRKQASQAG